MHALLAVFFNKNDQIQNIDKNKKILMTSLLIISMKNVFYFFVKGFWKRVGFLNLLKDSHVIL